ncbi:unnamed protein product [Auanema sp. JU1783]|nr:unnamed protein product [Auanema sp. JU1783]
MLTELRSGNGHTTGTFEFRRHRMYPSYSHISLCIMKTLFIIIFFTRTVVSQYYCADEVQKCAIEAEDNESIVQNLKEEAFRKCFKRPACHEEKKVFDRCYKSAIRSLRGSVRDSANEKAGQEMFSVSMMNYRSSADRCFLNSPFVPQRRRFGPVILDEDIVYARILLSGELADRLWGLPELGRTRPSLDTAAICRTKEESRVFGGGISRLFHTGDPKINNLTTSCLLEDSELLCYRQFLDNNAEFLQAIFQRDYMFRTCLARVRTETPCRNNDHSRLRTCICNVRERLDHDLQMDLLDCVRRTSIHNIEAVHDSDTKKVVLDIPKPKISKAPTSHLTPGFMVNGNCMCNPDSSLKSSENVMISSDLKIETTSSDGLIRFREDSPRLMQPSDAHSHLDWSSRDH